MARAAALALLLAVVGIGAAASAAPPKPPAASATATLAAIVTPDAPTAGSEPLAAPPGSEVSAPYLYPEDGSIVRVGSSRASVAAQAGTSSSAQALVSALGLSLFGGEITAESLDIRVRAAAGVAAATATGSGSTVTGLVVNGEPISPSPGATLALGDWGTLDVLATTEQLAGGKNRAADASVVGLRIVLTADHGGLAAGSVITIAAATAAADAGSASTTGPGVTPPPTPKPKPKPPAPRPRPAGAPQEPGASVDGRPPELVKVAPEVTARLTDGGYVFPLYGPASFGDSFGAPRPSVPGGWHHGEDLLAPTGTPILAVADGTVFGVGWNELGGWKLWLRDRRGNEFYYAHLSAYSPLAVEGTNVAAGDVLGFVGDTGDATGVPHLHFEIHPVELLYLGYDGVVAPYPFLVAWQRAQDVAFDAGRRYIGSLAGGRGLAPPSGAVLLEIDDISRTSGLVPGALERAVVVQRVDVEALRRRPN